MALSKGIKIFLGFVLVVCCWLSNASLHVADGPAQSDGSKVLGPVVLDVKFAMYHGRLPAGQADVSDHLRTGLPVKLPEDSALQAVICGGKAALLLATLVCLVGFRCSFEGQGTEGLEPASMALTDLEMGLAATPANPLALSGSEVDSSDIEPELDAMGGGAEGQEFLEECWGESEAETEDEEGEPRISNDCRDKLIVQAATMGVCIKHCDALELYLEAGRIALARLDKKSGEQGDALDESDAASLLDPELFMVAAVKSIGGLMMSKLCHGKGRQGRAA